MLMRCKVGEHAHKRVCLELWQMLPVPKAWPMGIDRHVQGGCGMLKRGGPLASRCQRQRSGWIHELQGVSAPCMR